MLQRNRVRAGRGSLYRYAVHGVASNQSDRVPHVPDAAYHGRRNSHNRRRSDRDLLEVGVIGRLGDAASG